MKIKRFENNPDIKWDNNKIEELYQLEEDVKILKESLKKLLLKYLELHPELQTEADKNDPLDLITSDDGYIDFFILYPNDLYSRIEISYYPNSDNDFPYNTEISKRQYPDFLEFIKNPEMYINAKKFNI